MTQRVLPYNRGIVGQERNYDCGPASEQNVLSSRITVSEADLIRSVGTTTDGTAWVGLIERDLNRRVPDARYTTVLLDKHDPPTSDEFETFWRNVKSSIDAGWGVVMNWVSPPNNPPRAIMGSTNPNGYGRSIIFHYVAAMGYDDNYDGKGGRAIWVADSGFAPFGYWVTAQQACGLITPKGYAYAAVAPAAAPPPVAPTQAPIAIKPVTPVAATVAKLTDPRTITDINPNAYVPRGQDPGWLVVHTSESTSRVRDLNNYCKGHQVSYDRVGDDRDILCAVEDGNAPWAAVNANRGGLHFCFSCSFAGWSREQWLDADAANDGVNERAALRLGAKQFAFWSQSHGIPAQWIGGGARPPYGQRGICGHVDFAAWGGGHFDPGVNFPVSTFMSDVAFWLTGQEQPPIAPPPPVVVPGTNPDKYADWLLYQGNPRNDVNRVMAVQHRLKFAYADYGAALAVDGDFGPATKAAVQEFQRRSGLVADGIVGPMTAAALKP